MDDDRAHAGLAARRAHLQAAVFGAGGARLTGSERQRVIDELTRIDAQLAGSAPAPGAPSAPAPASTGSSATWLAAVAEAKLATWTERSEAAARHSETARLRRAAESSAPATGVFHVSPLGEELDGRDDGAIRSESAVRSEIAIQSGGEVGEDGDTSRWGHPDDGRRRRDARARLTPFAVGLALCVVLVAAGVGFGVGAKVASVRGDAGGGIRASAAASDPATPGADDGATDWRGLASQQALAEFSRNQLSGDLPPDTVSDDHFRADSFRLLLTGSIADWTGRVYAAKDIEGEICVVLVQPDSSYSAGCATPDQFARGGVQVTTDVSIVIRAEEDGSESMITGVTATWPANGMTGLRFSSARSAG